MRQCMWKKLDERLQQLEPRKKLNESSEVHERMKVAMSCNTDIRPRYTLIPAAVGTSEGWFYPVGDGHRQSLIRGGLTACYT